MNSLFLSEIVLERMFCSILEHSLLLVIYITTCRAKGPWLDSPSRRFKFRDLQRSRDMAEISPKRCKSSTQPTNHLDIISL